MICQHVGVLNVPFQCSLQRWHCFFIKPQNQFLRRWCTQNLIEKDFEIRARDRFQTQGRFAHFTDALAQGSDMLGAIMRVQAESHFELVNRFCRQPRREYLVQSLQGIMITFAPGDTLLPRQPRFHGVRHGADSG
jgi:hypothetical protein